MNIRVLFTGNLFLRIIFAASLFILILISGITYKNTNSLTDSMEWVVHSYKVSAEAEKLFSHLKDGETGQRGFIITDDSTFLEPYYNSRIKIDSAFNALNTLLSDNLQQQNNLRFLMQLVNHRFAQYELSLKYNSAATTLRSRLNSNLREGYDINKLIEFQINKIINLENKYLKERQNKFEFKSNIAPVFTLALLMFSLIVFVISYIKINNDLINQKTANEKLMIYAETMSHAESIGEFFLAQWDLKTNKITYSDNFYTMLGYESSAFEATIESYLNLVHPDDRQILKDGAENVMKSNKVYPRTYRIIRSDGELIYLKTMGKIISDEKGNKMHISVARDITQFQISQLALEKRNNELEQSISELESFNHVASHDLQEPLRKIQTFLSRISENELSTLDAKSKEYIERIQISVTRMRTLINALLLYSRTNKSEKMFEKTDLGFLLENALQELSQVIEEKNPEIHFKNLPTLNVIPFQIQQLFYNLISNSLKYNQPGVSPVVNIDCKKVKAPQIPIINTDSNLTYYKISVSDNGLGFEQQYAEKIFGLFNRLHNGDYPGTGIGLSICKKIIENHAGYIQAEGEPNAGATFTFYLPA